MGSEPIAFPFRQAPTMEMSGVEPAGSSCKEAPMPASHPRKVVPLRLELSASRVSDECSHQMS